MSEPVIIQLGGDPQGKGRGRVGRLHDGRPVVFTPAATRKYEAALRLAASEAMTGRAPFSGAIEVVVLAEFMPPASWSEKKRRNAVAGLVMPTKKPDADNLLKVLDALNSVVWVDDSQIVTATIRKLYAVKAALTITVRQMELVGDLAPAPGAKQADIFARAEASPC